MRALATSSLSSGWLCLALITLLSTDIQTPRHTDRDKRSCEAYTICGVFLRASMKKQFLGTILKLNWINSLSVLSPQIHTKSSRTRKPRSPPSFGRTSASHLPQAFSAAT